MSVADAAVCGFRVDVEAFGLPFPCPHLFVRLSHHSESQQKIRIQNHSIESQHVREPKSDNQNLQKTVQCDAAASLQNQPLFYFRERIRGGGEDDETKRWDHSLDI